MGQHLVELAREEPAFLVGQLQAGQARDVGDDLFRDANHQASLASAFLTGRSGASRLRTMSQCPKCGAVLPSPGDRFCMNCGAEVNPDAPPPLPPPLPEVTAAPGAAGEGTSWDRRDQLGAIPALFDTIKAVLFSPAEFYRTMPKTGGIGAPLAFGLIVGYLGLLVATIYSALTQTLVGSAFRNLDEGPFARVAPLLEGGLGFIGNAILGPFYILIGLFVGAGLYHLVLMILGEARQGFETTFRVVCYGQSAAVLQVVPFCGGVVMAVWLIVVNIIGLSEAHGIGRGSAAIAVLAPVVLCCCCVALVVLLVFGGIAGLASQLH